MSAILPVTRSPVRPVVRGLLGGGGFGLPAGVPDPDFVWDFTRGSLAARQGRPAWTFTRASGDRAFNPGGVLATLANDVAAFPHRYVNGVWRPDGISLQGATTNLALQSADFATTWAATRGAVDVNVAAAPDGTTTADRLKDDSSGGNNSVLFGLTVSGLTAAVKHTAGGFFKADQTSWVALIFTNFTSVANNTGVWFDLTNGVVGATNTGFTASIRSVGNGWFQCSATFTADAADTSGLFRVYLSEGDGSTSVGLDGTTSIFAWGVQFEAKPYPTSYVPTTTGTATRAAISMTRPITALPGTVLIRGRTPGGVPSANQQLWAIDDGTSDNRIRVARNALNQLIVTARTGATTVANMGAGTVDPDTEFALALRIQADNYGVCVNGGTVSTDTSGGLPVGVTTDRVGTNQSGGEPWDGTVQTLIEWPAGVYLNDNQLRAVTEALAA